MTTSTAPRHDPVDDPRLPGRRRIDGTAGRLFAATMRNDFLTPRGAPYKWQELTASLERTVTGGEVPTVIPARYEWHRVESRSGTPSDAGQPREWTFARGQSFDSVLLHAELTGTATRPVPPAAWTAAPQGPPPAGPRTPPIALGIGYPALPKSPAVDLLLMLTWDVITLEMLCTHLTTTPELREAGSRAELERISGTWAELQFSDPGAVGVFRNAAVSAQHLGAGSVAGRPSTIYTVCCLDCVLNVRSGPVSQRGRSSYWITLQADAETADLLAAEMTEMIVATVSGQDGRRVPVFKRRIVRMQVPAAVDATAVDTGAVDTTANGAGPDSAVSSAGPADLAEAVRLAGRVADYLTWQATSLENLPRGLCELVVMGFRSVVGTDIPGAHGFVMSLQASLQAVARRPRQSGSPDADDLRNALPEHRRRLEGLLAFGHLAADGTRQGLVPDEAEGRATLARLAVIVADVTALLAVLDQLERPARPAPPYHRATVFEEEP
jgi:hypothetical protein